MLTELQLRFTITEDLHARIINDGYTENELKKLNHTSKMIVCVSLSSARSSNVSFHTGLRLLLITFVLNLNTGRTYKTTYGSDFPIISIFFKAVAFTTVMASLPWGLSSRSLQKKKKSVDNHLQNKNNMLKQSST